MLEITIFVSMSNLGKFRDKVGKVMQRLLITASLQFNLKILSYI